MKTKNGAECLAVNANGTHKRGKKVSNTGDRSVDFVEAADGDWCFVQMLPATPQRFEWVRKGSLASGEAQS